GTLNIGAAPGDAPVAPGTLSTPAVAFGLGTGTLNFNHTASDYVFAPAILGNATVNVLAGTTILTAASNYTGLTTVDGAALIVNGSIVSGPVIAGDARTGALTIANGGTVSDPGSLIGNQAGSQGIVTVTGVGSTWSNGVSLNVGFGGNGTLIIANGGAVSSQ